MAADYGPNNINIVPSLQAVPGEGADLTTVLYMVDEAGGNALGGSRFLSFNSTTDVAAALTAASISSAVSTALNTAFGQTPQPGKILVGRVDTGGAETYSTAYAFIKTAVAAAGSGFYGVAIDKRSDAEILLVSADVETDGFRQFFLQSADSDWLTSGFPAALTAIEGREQTIITYHDTAVEVQDLAWACNRLAISPDRKSVGYPAKLFGVNVNATAPTSSQQALALANQVNLGLPWLTAANWISPGVNAAGRPAKFIRSVDWFVTRLEERWTAMLQDASLRGDIIPVNAQGQAQAAAILNGLIEEGLAIGHFDTDTKTDGTILPRVIYPTITAADKAAQRIPIDAEILWATAGQAITSNLFFTQTA